MEQTTKTNGRVTRLEQGYDTLCDDVHFLNSIKDETKGRDKVGGHSRRYFLAHLAHSTRGGGNTVDPSHRPAH